MKKKIVHFSPLILLLFFCVYLFTRPNKVLYPKDSGEFHIYSDQKSGGNSFTTIKRMNDFTFFEISLKSGYREPYAGFTFNFPQNDNSKNYFDLSIYERIKLELSTENVKDIDISINTYEQGISDTLDPVSYRHNTIKVLIKENTAEYFLNLDKAKTPNWWYKNYQVSEIELPSTDWSSSYNLSFLPNVIVDGPTGYITVKNITLYKNHWMYLTPALLLFILYYLGLGLMWVINKKKKQQKEVVVSYVQRPLKDHKSTEKNTVIDFIAENYHQPNLSISYVAEATGIPQRAVSKILFDDLGKTFKSYVNDLRLKEAKRLLISTRNSISEIAYAVGFNSPNNFNRVFKTHEDTTPSTYRKNTKETITN